MKPKNPFHFLALLYSIFLIPFASAQYASNYLRYPWEIVQSPWILFVMIFALFFAVTYVAIGKSIQSKGPAAVISIVIALFIAAAFSQRTWYYGYLGEGVGSWIIGTVSIVGLFLLLKALSSIMGIIFLASLFLIRAFINSTDPFNYIPNELYNQVFPFIEFLRDPSSLYLLVIITLVLFAIAYMSQSPSGKKVKDWLWGNKKKESLLEKALLGNH